MKMKTNYTYALLSQVNEEWKAESSNLRLGELIKSLEMRPGEQAVTFDFCGMSIDKIISYRGFYEDLALVPCKNGDGLTSVDQPVRRLKNAIGESFSAYKGGDYVMSVDTIIWVAKIGEMSSTAVIGVTGDDYRTIIETMWVRGLMR